MLQTFQIALVSVNVNIKSQLKKLHPRSFHEYRYPHFQKSQELKLCGGLVGQKSPIFMRGEF